jgi:hypothetical protein
MFQMSPRINHLKVQTLCRISHLLVQTLCQISLLSALQFTRNLSVILYTALVMFQSMTHVVTQYITLVAIRYLILVVASRVAEL